MEVKESIGFTTRIYNFLSGLGLPVSPVEFAQAVYSIEQAKPKTYDALKRIVVPIMARNKEQHLLLLQIIDFLMNTSEDWERLGNSMGIKHIDPLILRESAPTIAKILDWVAHPELFYKRLQELYLELHDRYQERMENSGYMLLAEALELDRPEKELAERPYHKQFVRITAVQVHLAVTGKPRILFIRRKPEDVFYPFLQQFEFFIAGILII